MISNQCVSVSQLARHASAVLRKVKATGKQFVFVNNQPQAVILDIRAYEALGLPDDDANWTPELEASYQKADRERTKGGAVSLEDFKKNF